jgi:FAD/FMN-containing dehydrogenase
MTATAAVGARPPAYRRPGPSQTPRIGRRLGGPAGRAREKLAPRLNGSLYSAGDDGYDERHSGYNLLVEHRPAVIVEAAGPSDVVAAVEFAAEHELALGVLNTGHGVPVAADKTTLLVNTGQMKSLYVDPHARTARIEAGVRWDRAIHECALFGLAPPSGSTSAVGAVGYTLGGGLSLLGRTFGYAADHVRNIDVVTAHGSLRRADSGQFSDLFWGLRGGMGNFGVVTSMELDLLPVSRIYGGALSFRATDAPKVLDAYRHWVHQVPDEMSSSVALIRFPWDETVPAELRGRFVVQVRIAYHGGTEPGERLVRPLRTIALPIQDSVRDMPFSESGSIHNDPTTPTAMHDRNTFLRDWDEDALDELLHLAGPDSACPLRVVELRHLGGALGREPAVPNAVDNRDAAFQLYTATVSEEGYADVLLERMAPWSAGTANPNFLGVTDADPARVRAAFTERTYRRLAHLKRAYDPDNMFRVNHNIPPTLPDRT